MDERILGSRTAYQTSPGGPTIESPGTSREEFSAVQTQHLSSNSLSSIQVGYDAAMSSPERLHLTIHESPISPQAIDAPDVQMGGDGGVEEFSSDDNKTVTPKARRRKTSQRFYCTDFAPCNLSFTRSEHLARHIRKHTGERPFSCHCGRLFSRLDNLRQHAQTVHSNEDIPAGSLATGLRIQRQSKAERVRATSARSRAGSGASGGVFKGHSRNMSSTSVLSATSTLHDGYKKQVASLLVDETNHEAETDLEGAPTPRAAPIAPDVSYAPLSPSGYLTPLSYGYSTGPRSSVYSPDSPQSMSRSQPHINGTCSTRPLSGTTSAPALSTPPAMPAFDSPYSHERAPSQSDQPSFIYSHIRTTSELAFDPRPRTWHSASMSEQLPRPATSGLAYQQSPDDVRPSLADANAAAQGGGLRLPGIESFDRISRMSPLAHQRTMSTPYTDGNLAQSPHGYPARPAANKRHSTWETSLNSNLDRLAIASANSSPVLSELRHTRQLLPAFRFPQMATPESGGACDESVEQEEVERTTQRDSGYFSTNISQISPEDSKSPSDLGIGTPNSLWESIQHRDGAQPRAAYDRSYPLQVHVLNRSPIDRSGQIALGADHYDSAVHDLNIVGRPIYRPPFATTSPQNNTTGRKLRGLDALIAVATSGNYQ